MFKRLIFLFCCALSFAGRVMAAAPHHDIKAVVFDFGGVVATYERQSIIDFLTTTFRCDAAALKPALQGWKAILQQGGDEQAYWRKYAGIQNIVLPDDWFEQLIDVQVRSFVAIPGTMEAVASLRAQGYTVAMLSNVTQGPAAVVRRAGFYDHFDPLLLSYEIGIEKPDAAAYRILIDTLALPPSSIVFIDDKVENVAAASRCGLRAIVFRDGVALLDELRALGVAI